jgi:hypothetical protein
MQGIVQTLYIIWIIHHTLDNVALQVYSQHSVLWVEGARREFHIFFRSKTKLYGTRAFYFGENLGALNLQDHLALSNNNITSFYTNLANMTPGDVTLQLLNT